MTTPVVYGVVGKCSSLTPMITDTPQELSESAVVLCIPVRCVGWSQELREFHKLYRV